MLGACRQEFKNYIRGGLIAADVAKLLRLSRNDFTDRSAFRAELISCNWNSINDYFCFCNR